MNELLKYKNNIAILHVYEFLLWRHSADYIVTHSGFVKVFFAFDNFVICW